MKAVRVAIILLICSSTFVVTNSLVLSSIIDNVLINIESEDENLIEAKEKYTRIYDELKGKMSYISLTVNHEDLTSITEGFAELIGTLEANDGDAFTTVKSRLISSLEHIRRLAGINIDSIL